MDPIAHTLVGAALAKTPLGERTPYATVTLIAAANLPDVDALAYFVSSDFALLVRRGLTHGPLGFLLLPPLLVALVGLLRRLRVRAPTGSPERARFATRRLLALAYLGCFTHPLLDWLNTYGVRLLMPFDDRWFYGDVLFIIDPWFWLILAAGVVLASEPRRRSHLLWAAVGLIASVPVLLAPLPKTSQLVWLLGALAVLVARWIWGVSLYRSRTTVASIAIVIWCSYLGAMLLNARAARDLALAEATRRATELGLELPIERALVGPMPATAMHRDVLLQTRGGYRHGSFHWLAQPHLRLNRKPLPLLEQHPDVEQALRDPALAGFANWMRFPSLAADPRDPERLWILDARYQRHVPTQGSPANIGAVPVDMPVDRK